jgi:branched-chain amino acid transport system ATP-binding protein
MPGRAAVPAGGLSHGDRRKLELAMALASEPTVLLLDEPMAGVSAEDVDGLTTIIGEVRDAGVAVLMVEHHMHVVLGLADRVAVLHHGRLLACGSADDVTSDAQVQQAYLGEAL